jgi:hypothetical protein
VRTDSWGKLAFVTTQTAFVEKPLPLTGFGEQRQVLFRKHRVSDTYFGFLRRPLRTADPSGPGGESPESLNLGETKVFLENGRYRS